MPGIKKLFAFGQMLVNTPNAPGGEVLWWYHVVPVAMVGEQVYVLDPAVSPKDPLKLNDWVERLLPYPGVQTLKFSLCSKDTFTPFDSCTTPHSRKTDLRILREARGYLADETQNLTDLGRNLAELGNLPPWRLEVHSWGEHDRRGEIGTVFKYDNPYSGQREYFRLTNLWDDGRYWYFPTGQQDNWHWQYLGNTVDQNFISEPHQWGENDRQGEIDTIFKYDNPYSGQKDYFRLTHLGGDRRYWYFPTDRTNNWYWEYQSAGYVEPYGTFTE